ncbi:hypothetical protein IAU60_003232 [Kwoniella sp. DSM 27419]
MSGQPRQRTAAQRKSKAEDYEVLGPDEILDEQGQESEVRRLRAKNESDNGQAQTALDVGVLMSTFIAVMHIVGNFSAPTPMFTMIGLLQLALLPLSLTPSWLPFLPKMSPDIHLYAFSIQLTMSLCAIFLRYYHGLADGDMPFIELNEVARWAMPALVVGAVDMQRRGERRAEEKLALLEGMKYNHKGA